MTWILKIQNQQFEVNKYAMVIKIPIAKTQWKGQKWSTNVNQLVKFCQFLKSGTQIFASLLSKNYKSQRQWSQLGTSIKMKKKMREWSPTLDSQKLNTEHQNTMPLNSNSKSCFKKIKFIIRSIRSSVDHITITITSYEMNPLAQISQKLQMIYTL